MLNLISERTSRIILGIMALVFLRFSAIAEETVLSFTGNNSYVNIGTPSVLQIPSNQPLTFESWVYLNSLKVRDTLLSKCLNRTASYTYMFGFYESGKIAAYPGSGSWMEPSPSVYVSAGQWYHIAFSFDGTTMSYYIDGELVGTSAFSFSNNTGHGIFIGGYSTSSDINGYKSEVRLWNYARSQTEIQQKMAQRMSGTETGLLGYWPLNEGTGSIVYDGTANGNDGTIANASWTTGDLSFSSFALAHPVTGSLAFTNTNELQVTGFPLYDGYPHYQITEGGAQPDPAPGAWSLTNNPPDTVVFTTPAWDTNVTITAWLTNLVSSVSLLGESVDIVYTTVAPIPAVEAELTRYIIEGSTATQITLADIDIGTTPGEYGGEPLEFFSISLYCAGDVTPAEPEVLLNAVGVYDVVLTAVNEAGNAASATSTVTVLEVPADTRTWTGAGADALASTAENWASDTVPGAGDQVRLDNAHYGNVQTNVTWDLDIALGSWTQTENYSGTVTIRTRFPEVDGPTTFEEMVITGNLDLQGGTWTHTDNPVGNTELNRLAVRVGGDFTVGPNALVDVNGKGYTATRGPGAGGSGIYSSGATHGGIGGSSPPGMASRYTYGSIVSPTNHGSGAGGPGGGTLVVQVDGAAEINGTLRSVGVRGTGNAANTSPAGGSIWLTAGSFSGSGAINASGVEGYRGGGGGGGRIALIATAGTSFGNLQLLCAGGGSHSGDRWAGAGTIYLQNMNQLSGQGKLIVSNPTSYSILNDHSRTYTLMPLAGSYRDGPVNLDDFAQIVISNKAVLAVNSDTILSDFSPSHLIVSGPQQSYLNIQSTNAVTFPADLVVNDYCLLMDTPAVLPGNLTIGPNGVVSHSRNGTTEAWKIDLTVPGDLIVQSGGRISADQVGFSGPYHNAIRYNSASYGGRGQWTADPSNVSQTYGSIVSPTNLGSHATYRGGGAVLLNVAGTTTMDGGISANAQPDGVNESNGSGGTVWLRTGYLVGNGVIDAAGGTSRNNGGGGGRISVVLRESDSFGNVTMKAYGGEDYWLTRTWGAAGTIYRQTQSQGAGQGDLIVNSYVHNNTNNWDTVYTELPPVANSDASELEGVTLRALTNCTIGLSQDLVMHNLYLTRDDSILYLNGHVLKLRVPRHRDWGTEDRVVYDGGRIEWLTGTLLLLR